LSIELEWLPVGKPAFRVALHILFRLTDIAGSDHHLSFIECAVAMNKADAELVPVCSEKRGNFGKEVVPVNECAGSLAQ